MNETVAEFFDAIKADDIFGLTTMINQDQSLVDCENENGLPAVLFAIYYGRKEVALLLVQSGAKVDVFVASALNDLKRLERALAKDPEALSKFSVDGWTPVHLAAFYRQKEALAYLLEKGAPVDVRSKNNMSNLPIHAAAAGGNRDIVAMLLERGADVHERQNGGWTPLHSAAQNGDLETVKLLLAHGANVDVRAENGQTALDLAMGKGSQAVVDLLMQAPKVQ